MRVIERLRDILTDMKSLFEGQVGRLMSRKDI